MKALAPRGSRWPTAVLAAETPVLAHGTEMVLAVNLGLDGSFVG
jgi:hypothetical protein